VALLLGQDRAPDRPVQQDELGVDGTGGPLACRRGALDDRVAQRDVVSGRSDLLSAGRRYWKSVAVVDLHARSGV